MRSRAQRSTVGPKLGKPAPAVEQAPASLKIPRAVTWPRPFTSAQLTPQPSVVGGFNDDFEREELGENYHATSSSGWRIANGQLCAQSPHNHPLWLVPKLSKNARIEFDAVSHSNDGDIKVEAWGDGRSAATTTSYTDASGYILIYGGWKNSLHVIARLNEHGRNRSELRLDPDTDDPRSAQVEAGRSYHFVVERRDGRTLRLSVDEIEILKFVDPAPLFGEDHDHFAFNAWEAPVCFDNLNILPLDG